MRYRLEDYLNQRNHAVPTLPFSSTASSTSESNSGVSSPEVTSSDPSPVTVTAEEASVTPASLLPHDNQERPNVATIFPGVVSPENSNPDKNQPEALFEKAVHGASVTTEMQTNVQYSIQQLCYKPCAGSGGAVLLPANCGLPTVQFQTQQMIYQEEAPPQAHKSQFERQYETRFQPLRDAHSFLDKVEGTFGKKSKVYRTFLVTLLKYKSEKMDVSEVTHKASILFRAHPELIIEMNSFLPLRHKINVKTSPSGSAAGTSSSHLPSRSVNTQRIPVESVLPDIVFEDQSLPTEGEESKSFVNMGSKSKT